MTDAVGGMVHLQGGDRYPLKWEQLQGLGDMAVEGHRSVRSSEIHPQLHEVCLIASLPNSASLIVHSVDSDCIEIFVVFLAGLYLFCLFVTGSLFTCGVQMKRLHHLFPLLPLLTNTSRHDEMMAMNLGP